jgi:hypothetical protein
MACAQQIEITLLFLYGYLYFFWIAYQGNIEHQYYLSY